MSWPTRSMRGCAGCIRGPCAGGAGAGNRCSPRTWRARASSREIMMPRSWRIWWRSASRFCDWGWTPPSEFAARSQTDPAPAGASDRLRADARTLPNSPARPTPARRRRARGPLPRAPRPGGASGRSFRRPGSRRTCGPCLLHQAQGPGSRPAPRKADFSDLVLARGASESRHSTSIRGSSRSTAE